MRPTCGAFAIPPCGPGSATRTGNADVTRNYRRFHRQPVRRHRLERRHGDALPARSQEFPDKAPAGCARRDGSAVFRARRGVVGRKCMARSPFPAAGRAGAARRLDRHRRHPAPPCPRPFSVGPRSASRAPLDLTNSPHSIRCGFRCSSSSDSLPTDCCEGLRDRSALLASENRSIGRLAVGAVVVIPLYRHRLPGARSRFPDQAWRVRSAARRHGRPDRWRWRGDPDARPC